MGEFKAQLDADLDAFFNTDEFAETHNIDGVDIPVIIIDNITRKRDKFNAIAASGGYVYNGDINNSALLYQCKTSDLKVMPVAKGRQIFDEQILEVVEVSEKSGVTEVLLWGLGGRIA